MSGFPQKRMFRGHSVNKQPMATPARFVTNGASAPDATLVGGAATLVQRLVQAGLPFWRVTLKNTTRLIDVQCQFQVTVNGLTALFDGVAQVVRGGLTDDTEGVISPENKTKQFDVLLVTGGVGVDTAGASIEVLIHHDAR